MIDSKLIDKMWVAVRLAIVAVGGWSGISFASPQAAAESNVDWPACLFMLIASPFMLVIVIGFQTILPWSKQFWRRPRWNINPFNVTEPLQFFHLCAFYIMAGGVVGMISLPFRGLPLSPLSVSLISAGVGTWLGIQWSMRIFRTKMMPGNE